MIGAMMARQDLEPGLIDDVVMGAAAQQGTQGYNLGRLCATASGLPDSVAGMTMDRQCASGYLPRLGRLRPRGDGYWSGKNAC